MSVPAMWLLLTVGVTASWCGSGATEPPTGTRRIRIATGNPNGVYYALGVALARAYTAKIPQVEAFAEPTPALAFNTEAIRTGSADVAFSSAGFVYRAYRDGESFGTRLGRELRAIAVLHPTVNQIIVRRDSRFGRIEDLQGARIAAGLLSTGPPEEIATPQLDLIARAHGLTNLTIVRLGANELATALSSGKVDGVSVSAGFPMPVITRLARDVGIRLLEIDQGAALRIRAQEPFLKPVIIPGKTYPGQLKRVRTVGVDSLLVCGKNLDTDLVYELTRVLFESIPELEHANAAARQIDPYLAPATPIPLHGGAARYYRERQLLK